MKSSEIREKFLKFFEERGHAIIKSASLVPTDEKGVTDNTLFNSAGMQPLIPFILGEEHPKGTRLVDSQKCLRTVDIDEVGDNTHNTFFEMLGNWSLGDYFKEETIQWSFEFLTEELGLDKERLYVTVFEGDDNAPKDEESYNIWKKYIKEDRIYYMGADSNWWSAGDNGPCGPDSEMFYDTTKEGLGNLTKEEYIQADEKQEVVEIWNDVFMEYQKKEGKVIGKLPNKNVDTGAGFGRLVAVVQGKDSVYDTDLFEELMNISREITKTERSARILSDHIKASVFLISDGILPSNTDRGYILRRLIRRAAFNTNNHNLHGDQISSLVDAILDTYDKQYPELKENLTTIKSTIEEEVIKFSKTLSQGLREFGKISGADISGIDAFKLFSSYGLPIDLTVSLAEEKGISVNREEYEEEFKKHQDLSRTSSAGKFKGGLSGTSEMEVKYHTATHLLQAALREVLGDNVEQKGSNITPDRLRFDFSHGEKMTDEEKEKVEAWVNDKIEKGISVEQKDMDIDTAKAEGAISLFGEKYGEVVSVYSIGDVSKELCGGPHVENTSVLGKFRIKKEEASSSGVRRIKAVLE
ncbi:MAG: alanyl-tRNA synthetase [Candidatus Paceibacteria bacterium]|jgi:alanyl-tRNA synthetase